MKIPFKFLPGSWGLKGTKYKEAEAYYLYTGKELDFVLNTIAFEEHKDQQRYLLDEAKLMYRYGLFTPYEYAHKCAELKKELTPKEELRLKYTYGAITEYEYDIQCANLIEDATEKELALNEANFKHNKITLVQYEKEKANINKEPWIDVVDHGFDKSKGLNGVYFEFDWNDQWIQYLRLNGYTGLSDEDVVEAWFKDVCNTMYIEDHHG